MEWKKGLVALVGMVALGSCAAPLKLQYKKNNLPDITSYKGTTEVLYEEENRKIEITTFDRNGDGKVDLAYFDVFLAQQIGGVMLKKHFRNIADSKGLDGRITSLHQ